MEQLPYIDEHSIFIDATRERVWGALSSTLRESFGRRAPAPLARLLRLAPAGSCGDGREALSPGSTLPGFAVAEAHAPERLALRGGHRFSRYALVFELDAAGPGPAGVGHCNLRAQTWAEFPGLSGDVYRALVIGSGGHRLVVRRLLRDVARRA
jgi:hypothetical protein